MDDELKSYRASADSATKIALVLFAALIQSWALLNDRVNLYRGGLALRKRVEFNVDNATHKLRRGVRGYILGVAKTGSESERTDWATKFEGQQNPIDTLKQLPAEPEHDTARKAIEIVRKSLSKNELAAIQGFREERLVVETVSFKLLGLDFAANGLWAWSVGCCSFSGDSCISGSYAAL